MLIPEMGETRAVGMMTEAMTGKDEITGIGLVRIKSEGNRKA